MFIFGLVFIVFLKFQYCDFLRIIVVVINWLQEDHREIQIIRWGGLPWGYYVSSRG